MSLSERINTVNEKNKQREDELKLKLNSLVQSIKNKVNESKTEIFYESPIETSISLFDIKSNQNYNYTLNYDFDINLSVNVFELIRRKFKSELIKLSTDNSIITFDPKTTIPNAILFGIGDMIVIKYHYEYDQKYRNYKVTLEKLGFDYEITLIENYYNNLYSFENESGKFRVDLEITLK